MEPFNSHNNTSLVDCSSYLQNDCSLMENYSSSLQTHQQIAPKKRKTTPDGNCTSSFQSKIKERKDQTKNKANNGEKRDDKAIIEGEISKEYIHVRARRGQATDSHSIAERIRREKIRSRMKALQDLVPGCGKVIGKASMLDEIINYVQSLQNQVEFLSMKLARMSPSTWHEYGLNLFGQTERNQGAVLSYAVLPNSLMGSSLDPSQIPGDISSSQNVFCKIYK